MAFSFPLTADESYYWLWSRHLSFNYVDHPPMIAWLNFFLNKIFIDPVVSVRIGAFIFTLLDLVVVFFISKESFPEKDNKLHYATSLVYLLIPGIFITWLSFIVDLPLVFIYNLSLLFFIKYLKSSSAKYLYLVGFFVGIGLWVKYSMSLLYLVLFFFPVLFVKQRKLFSFAHYWISGFVGLFVFSPLLVFGLLQFKESVFFHANRIGDSVLFLGTFDFIGNQILFFSPLLFVFFVLWLKNEKRYIHNNPIKIFLYLSSFIPFLFFLLLSIKTKIWPHWPLMSYAGITVLISGWLYENKKMFKCLVYGMIFFEIIFILIGLFCAPGIFISSHKFSENRLLAGKMNFFISENKVDFFLSDNHGLVAQLTCYADKPFLMPTGVLSVAEGVWGRGQFDKWNNRYCKKGENVLLYVRKDSLVYSKAQKNFDRIYEAPGKYKLEFFALEDYLKDSRFYLAEGCKLDNIKL